MNSPLISRCVNWEVWFMAVTLSSLALGCAPKDETTEITGHVSYKGKPVAGGVVNFYPQAGGRPIAGIIDDQGRFQTNLAGGDYAVSVQSSTNLPEGFKEGDPLPPPDPNAVPIKYSLQKKSGLKASISQQPAPQEINFDLK